MDESTVSGNQSNNEVRKRAPLKKHGSNNSSTGLNANEDVEIAQSSAGDLALE